MLVDLDIDEIRKTISYLRKTIEFENMVLPRDSQDNIIPAYDSPAYRRIREAEECEAYWIGVISDRRKNGARS